tara:strand:+ start:365 stop:655 length:291 start_codon:yes stop_codon:yes gene_type:complete
MRGYGINSMTNTVYTSTPLTSGTDTITLTSDYLDNITINGSVLTTAPTSASIVIDNEVLDGPTIAKLKALLDVISDVPEIAEKLNVELAIRKIAGQ